MAVTYSYHDPAGDKSGKKGSRNTLEVPKGFTIEQFLNKCREQVPALRSAAADQIIYVKEVRVRARAKARARARAKARARARAYARARSST